MKVITSELLRKFFNKLSDIFAKKQHTHTKSQITDFPTEMPASDVSSWAKSSTKPNYTKSEVGLGNVDNTADVNKSVKYATSAGSASSASKATGVVDYGATNKTIEIGYSGKGISGNDIKYIAGYTTGNGSDVNAKIKDVSKDALKSWLGLGSLAYSSATIPTIPSSLPANGGNSTTVNGHTVNSDVPENAVFTDTKTTVVNNLTTTTTGYALDANMGRVLSAQLNAAINELAMNKVMTESFSSGSIKITSPITTFYNHHSFSSDIIDLYAINVMSAGATYQLDLSYFTDSKIALMNGDMSTVYTVSISNNTVTISGNCTTYWVIRYNRGITTVTHP